ncbi:circularly permuted type 2 ATP-grasp protein [Azoarcus sp. DN11]|uniref:circularly permuted type 2 ATP-grasp protein n=1 Tax=Azoarcus sp. DN11 TaxID=356837 RepID=UPI000EABA7E2|nr:circularly permuted type 2 ATP-grasp protein [Azoarcus sp. DN11]AYH42476.1 molybdopterin oxidoreductase [Azoarcus sp. DN11]
MPHKLLSLYVRPTGRYDEMLAGAEQLRPHWRPLFEALDASTPDQMRARQAFVTERIRENGTTYNVYADPHGADRPWALDPLPFILPADEWTHIEAAVAQRADLLDRVLADLYGPQHLIRSGALPAALVYGHNGFLWPCQGTQPPSGHFLHVYAADLARSPDGRWWVIADRTQGPSGAGYALENRLIVSRLFPELFRDLRVHHLADFFRHMQDSLARWAPVERGETPFTVLLTPGPYNETYFEQSYLARYLGFPLVEGQDLTVRGDAVYLKTLGGLRRVHVILRRLDDDYTDPLELRGESSLGVPGLVEAARAGRVLVANALGSGVLESAGLLAFLPKLAERLLGEPLAMPAVASWWCGEAPALDYVVEHLAELVIKPAYPSQRMQAVFGRELDARGRAHWTERLRHRPHAYIGQELVQLSQAPVMPDAGSPTLDRRLLARAIGVRVYAVVTPDGWRVMPGGLTRVSGSGDVDILSMQRGGSSKDTWVLSDVPVSQFSLLKGELGAGDIVRAGPEIASRSAENLFWLGRYGERVENSARLLRFACDRLNEEGESASAAARLGAAALGAAAGDFFGEPGVLATAVGYCERFGLLPPEEDRSVARRLVEGALDENASGSLAATLRRAVWAATQVRDRLSIDHWHSLNRLHDILRRQRLDGGAPSDIATLLSTLDRVLLACVSLSGFAMDEMMRDSGWRFLILGRRIERLQCRSRIVAHFLEACGGQPAGVDALLELADCAEAYRQRYLRTPDVLPTLDLVVFDTDNPHAVAFQTDMLLRYLESLQRDLAASGAAEGEADYGIPVFRDAVGTLNAFSLHELELTLPDGTVAAQRCANCAGCSELARILHIVHDASATLSNRIAERFFTHVRPAARILSA